MILHVVRKEVPRANIVLAPGGLLAIETRGGYFAISGRGHIFS